MRRFVIVILLLTLLLVGCTHTEPEQTEQTTIAPTTETSQPTQTTSTLPGLYEKQSEMEAATGGAVREYELPQGHCLDIQAMGDDLLLIMEQGETTLTRVTGDDLNPIAERSLEALTLTNLLVQEDGIGYFDERRGSVVFLNGALEEDSCFALPENMSGLPAIAPDRGSVYYTTENDLRVLDLKTGISRLLKQTQYTALNLVDVYGNGSVLHMTAEDESGEWIDVFLSARTGETEYLLEEPLEFSVFEDRIFLSMEDGSVRLLVFGQVDEEYRCLVPEEQDYSAVPILEWNGCVIVTNDGNDTMLSYYDLDTGYRTAEVTLPGISSVSEFVVAGERIYFLGSTGEDTALYGWNITRSATRERLDHTDEVYTRDYRDTEGLANCTAWADRISDEFGVDLRIWEDAQTEAENVTLVGEYQVPAYRRDLAALESALEKFPAGFFAAAAEGTDSGTLHICLVRSIEGTAEELTGRDQSLQLWLAGDVYIFLTMGEDLVESFCHELSHVIDNRVFGTCVLFDDWEDLNPGSFDYDYNYETNLIRDDSEYLGEEDRAFIDTYSMSYPKEDRAAIFASAMGEGNGSYFESSTMQKKLRQLCLGIRESFGYEDIQEALPWEQYLEEPLYKE